MCAAYSTRTPESWLTAHCKNNLIHLLDLTLWYILSYALIIHSFILLDCTDFCCKYPYIRVEGMLDTLNFFSSVVFQSDFKVLGMKPKDKTKLIGNIIPVRRTKLSS